MHVISYYSSPPLLVVFRIFLLDHFLATCDQWTTSHSVSCNYVNRVVDTVAAANVGRVVSAVAWQAFADAFVVVPSVGTARLGPAAGRGGRAAPARPYLPLLHLVLAV